MPASSLRLTGQALRLGSLLVLLGVSFASFAAAHAQRPPSAADAARQPTAAPPPAGGDDSDNAETDSPRRALERFLNNARSGNLTQAADELYQISQDVEEMAQLARKLQAVIDRRLPFDEERLAKVSDAPLGNKSDGLAEQDEIGRIDMPLGSEPVRLQRKRLPDGGTHWIFSQKTVERIQAWYLQLPDHWLLDHLPELVLQTGPGGLLYWQWVALPILLLISAAFGFAFSAAVRLLGWMIFARYELVKAVLEPQTVPLRLLGAALALRMLLLSLFITASAEPTVRGLCNVVLILGVMFVVWRAADVLAGRVRQSSWLAVRPGLLGMAPLLQRLLEVGLWAAAVLWSLQAMGYSVTAVLASLGLGGLAVALAAKNSLEHLIGGMTLSLDQPMRVGDQVKIGDVQGQVERIGIRSTRIRTADRSLVTIPNGKLADLNIETLAARDRLRMALTLNINYNLKPAKLRELRDALIACVKAQPKLNPDSVKVHFCSLNELAIPVEISCYFDTDAPDQFAECRHALLLALLEIVDSYGALASSQRR